MNLVKIKGQTNVFRKEQKRNNQISSLNSILMKLNCETFIIHYKKNSCTHWKTWVLFHFICLQLFLSIYFFFVKRLFNVSIHCFYDSIAHNWWKAEKNEWCIIHSHTSGVETLYYAHNFLFIFRHSFRSLVSTYIFEVVCFCSPHSLRVNSNTLRTVKHCIACRLHRFS